MNIKQSPKVKNEKKQSNNAKTAFMELASMAGLTKATPTNQSQPTIEKKVEAFDVNKVVDSIVMPQSKPVASTAPVEAAIHETSLIAADVIVEGAVRTDGALDCRGTVKGDLSAKGRISMSGKQIGNIQGLQIDFANACVEGNITAKEHIEIDRYTKIKGDIQAGSVTLDGKVTGIICADTLVCLCKNAILIGDIHAGSISIEEGAQVSGQIIMNLPEIETQYVSSAINEL